MENNNEKQFKVASVLKNTDLLDQVKLTSDIECTEGEALLVEVTSVPDDDNEIELESGNIHSVQEGDCIAGVLGRRKALEGVVGNVPGSLQEGDRLHLLNLGGVIGKAESWNARTDNGPVEVEVLGAIQNGRGSINIQVTEDHLDTHLDADISLVLVSGTGMNTGKTTLATELIRLLSDESDLRVGAAKLTGVATQRDLFAMKEAGAVETGSFSDMGFTSTLGERSDVLSAAKTTLNRVQEADTDVIVAELGDGIVGWYGVDAFFDDPEIAEAISFHAVCANDLAGASGARQIIEQKGVSIDFFSGPVANNTAGTDYLKEHLGTLAGTLPEHRDEMKDLLTHTGVLAND